MGSPELDRVFWQDEGWNRLSRHLSRTLLRSPPQPEACPPTSTAKRVASLAAIDHSPLQSSLSVSTTSSSSLNYARKRKRARVSSYEDKSVHGMDSGSSLSSRAMQERITELARRLNAQSAMSPLREKTNIRHDEGPRKVAAVDRPLCTPAAGHEAGNRGPKGSRTAAHALSPRLRARPFIKSYSGPLQSTASAPRPQADFCEQRLRASEESPPVEMVGREVEGCTPISQAAEEHSDLEEGDSFEVLLSQVPAQELEAMLGAPSQPDSHPVTASHLSQEVAAALCAGLSDLSDFEDE